MPVRSARSTTSCAPTTAASSDSTPTLPGSGSASSSRWAGPSAGADVVVVGAGGAARAVVFAASERRRAAGDDRQPDGRVGRGHRGAVPRRRCGCRDQRASRRRRGRRRAPVGRPRGERDHGRAWSIRAPLSMSSSCRQARRSSTCVYVPAETPLVAAARARGLRAANGSEMLIAQAAIAFERWTGVGGMADVMRAAVAPLLADSDRREPDRRAARRSPTRCDLHRRAQLPESSRTPSGTSGAAPDLRQGCQLDRRGWRDDQPGIGRLTDNVDAEVELGVVIGATAWDVARPTSPGSSSATRSSTTSRRATNGSTVTSGCSASRCPGSARSARGSCRPPSWTRPASTWAAPSTAKRSRTGRPQTMRFAYRRDRRRS